jgi:hypothetical protein
MYPSGILYRLNRNKKQETSQIFIGRNYLKSLFSINENLYIDGTFRILSDHENNIKK